MPKGELKNSFSQAGVLPDFKMLDPLVSNEVCMHACVHVRVRVHVCLCVRVCARMCIETCGFLSVRLKKADLAKILFLLITIIAYYNLGFVLFIGEWPNCSCLILKSVESI